MVGISVVLRLVALGFVCCFGLAFALFSLMDFVLVCFE